MTIEIKAKVGNRIRELRKIKGLSQETLAGLAEIDRTYMTSVENGKRNISIVNIERIASALGVSVKEFFNEEKFDKKIEK
ncbi:MAG: helix-turn-helix domain-containing protein [Bacteroidales bacterium]